MLRFPGEDWCVELLEHRDYFGELLSVFELTAMNAVNLKMERKRKCKETVQGLCVKNISLKQMFCTVVFSFF